MRWWKERGILMANFIDCWTLNQLFHTTLNYQLQKQSMQAKRNIDSETSKTENGDTWTKLILEYMSTLK